MTDEQRRLTFLRENVEQLEEEKTSLERVLYFLQKVDENSAFETLRRLRAGSDVYEIAKEINLRSGSYGDRDQIISDADSTSKCIILHSMQTTHCARIWLICSDQPQTCRFLLTSDFINMKTFCGSYRHVQMLNLAK